MDVTTDTLVSALDVLIGKGDYILPEKHGAFTAALPVRGSMGGKLGASYFGRWHIDGLDPLRSVLDRRALVPIFLLSPCLPNGGGTKLIAGSHRDVAKLFATYGSIARRRAFRRLLRPLRHRKGRPHRRVHRRARRRRAPQPAVRSLRGPELGDLPALDRQHQHPAEARLRRQGDAQLGRADRSLHRPRAPSEPQEGRAGEEDRHGGGRRYSDVRRRQIGQIVGVRRIASLACVGPASRSIEESPTPAPSSRAEWRTMRRRFVALGRDVGAIGIGCGSISRADETNIKLVRRCFDEGFTLFDTADLYGESEVCIGKALSGVPRQDYVLSTKFGTVQRRWRRGKLEKDFSVSHMQKRYAESCERLRTDYRDVLLLHSPSQEFLESRQAEPLWRALDEMVTARKIGAYGVSISTEREAQTFLDVASGRVLEVPFNLLNQSFREASASLEARGVSLLAKYPIAGGTLTSSFGAAFLDGGDSRRQRWGEEQYRQRFTLSREMRGVFAEHGVDLTTGALRWILSVSSNVTPIPGIKPGRGLNELLAAREPLDPALVARLDAYDGGRLRKLALLW